MPSVKNSCPECPLKEIKPEDFHCYSLQAQSDLNKEVVSAVLFASGLEGGKKSKTSIDTAAKLCITTISSGKCPMYVLNESGFSFRNGRHRL